MTPSRPSTNSNPNRTIAIVLGTRPEGIKLAPLIKALHAHPKLAPVVISTGQHRELLEQALRVFDIKPDIDLELMVPGASLAELTARVLTGVSSALEDLTPDMVVVQGDTTTAMSAAMAAFYLDLPLAHLEAGLRTGDLRAPFPEEYNRVVISKLARLHLAPTAWAAQNLFREGISSQRVVVTGNTSIDALHEALAGDPESGPQDQGRRQVLVTAHRRENWQSGLRTLGIGLLQAVERHNDVHVLFPMHPNPVVRRPVVAQLSGHPRISLVEPLDYLPFCREMSRSHIILTDSGGIQEEAAGLGVPVLIMRKTTERPEAVRSGTARLIGTDTDSVSCSLEELLSADSRSYRLMATANNPFGDGRAAVRSVAAICAFFGLGERLPDFAVMS